jgi:hypothetical protein
MRFPNDMDGIMQRTRRYWYEDGISDLIMGGFLLLLGLLFAGESLTPPGSPLWAVWGMGLPMFLIGGGLVAGWAMQRLKSRVTYPRTGFVNYERKGLPRVATIVGLVLVAAIVAAGIVAVSQNRVNLTTLFGIAFLAAFGFVGYRSGLWRYVLIGLWCAVLGLTLAAFALTLEQSSAIFYVGAGLGMIVSGVLTWRRYDRGAPLPQEPSDGSAAQ